MNCSGEPMKDIDLRDNCADVGTEELSAGFDGELSGDRQKEISDHLDLCLECRKKFDAYIAIDKKIKEAVFVATEEEQLRQRLLVGVRTKLATAKNAAGKRSGLIWMSPVFLRIAASVIVCIGLGVYAVGKFYGAGAGNIDSGVVSSGTHNSFADDTSRYRAKNSGSGSISLPDFTAAGYNGRRNSAISNPQPPLKDSSPEYITNNVRHVWVVGNLNNVVDDIRDFARKHDIPVNKVVMSENHRKNGIKVNLRLTKKQLIELVRHCADSGLELVTPQAPQPECRKFFGNLDVPVQYNADFILNNK